jgi:hypothetical protein
VARPPDPLGDQVAIATVAGASSKKYKLAKTKGNVSYQTVSDQPEAEIGQPVAVRISFHGGGSYSTYNEQVAGWLINNGMMVDEPRTIRAKGLSTSVTLTGANQPCQYYFEADVNEAAQDDLGRPRLIAIGYDSTDTEINAYKISLAYGYTATGTGVTTSTASTLEDDRASWTIDEWVDEIVYSNGQKMTITSNTDKVLTGTGNWDGDPGDGQAYKIGVGDFGTLLATTQVANGAQAAVVGRPAYWKRGTNTYWYVPTGGTFIKALTEVAGDTGGDTYTTTADGGAGDATGRLLQVFKNKMARTNSPAGEHNKIMLLDKDTKPQTNTNWGGDHRVGGGGINITELGEASSQLYVGTEDSFYEFDGAGAPSAALTRDEIGYHADNCRGMVYHGIRFVVDTHWQARRA